MASERIPGSIINDFRIAQFRHLGISVGNNEIRIVSKFYLLDVIGQVLLTCCIILLITINPPQWFIGTILLSFSLFLFYFNFIGANSIIIDLIAKKVNVRHRIFLFRIIRRLFGMNTSLNFFDIMDVFHKEGTLLDRFSGGGYKTRECIFFKTVFDPTLTIAQVKTEEEALSLVFLLKNLIKGEEIKS